MKVIKSESVMCFDVDNTLVIHEKYISSVYADTVRIFDPVEGKVILMRKNKPMIRLLREEVHRGSRVIVWSRGGYEWASLVLTALGLEDLDILVMSKPVAYFDDKPVNEWLTNRIYLDPNEPYKTN